MGFLLGILRLILKLIIYTALVVTLVLVIPNLPPYTKFSNIPTAPTKERTGVLSPNSALNNAGKLYEGKIYGPEFFQIWKDELYTSLGTGEIVKLSPGGHVTFVTKIGRPCSGLAQEHICGRPLGFLIDDKSSTMYIADAYFGIWKVDLKTDRKEALVTPEVPIDGKKPKLFNAVALDKKGGIYFTDSSTDFNLKDGVFIALSDPAGRLIYHNPATKENKVLLDNIWFANGLALSPDESFVVVTETLQYRLLKYYISGPKKGKTEVFVDGLPGMPDNIRALPDGSGVQIALYTASDDETPIITKTLSSVPLARKFISRLLHLIEMPFAFLNSQFPHPIFEQVEYFIGVFSSISSLSDLSGLVITDWNGNIVASYYNTDKSIVHISDAIVYNDKLLLGCPHNQNYIGSVEVPALLKQAFSSTKAKESAKPKKPIEKVPEQKPINEKKEQKPSVRKDSPKPIEQSTTQKPTTQKPTTQKPTTQKPTTQKPTTQKPTTQKPTTQKPTTQKPTTQKPTTQKPTTQKETPSLPKEVKKEQIPEKVPAPKQPEINSKVVTESKTKQKNSQDKVSEEKSKVIKENTKSSHGNLKQDPENKSSKQSDKSSESGTGKDKKSEKPIADSPKKTNENIKDKKVKETAKKETIPKDIPIEEEIVSDTAKPNRDKLKVIKKSGPEEIPNPQI